MKARKVTPESDSQSQDQFFAEIAKSAGIVVVSSAVLQAIANKDREMRNVPYETWIKSALMFQEPITEALRAAGEVWTIHRGAAVVRAAAKETYDKIQNINRIGAVG